MCVCYFNQRSVFTRGLWSVMMSRSLQPRVKYFVCSRPQATTKASPSTGAYLCSAGDRKRDPASVTCHPPSQHTGTSAGQVQCFCNKKNPTPWHDQSGRKQVFLAISKISSPLIASIIPIRYLKSFIEFLRLAELDLGTEKRFEGAHDFPELGIVRHLVY
jgi:hypothetical protein